MQNFMYLCSQNTEIYLISYSNTMQIYKANILFTKERDQFEVIPNGYIAVEKGRVVDVYEQLPSTLASQPVTDLGDKLLIPAMNDMHVHAPTRYAERMYRRFVRDLWRVGTMRTVAFATVHRDSTQLLMNLFLEAGMGARVGKVDMNRNCPKALCESVEEAVSDNETLIAEYAKPNALVSPIITPRFVPSCTPELLQACGDLARKYNLPVQSHLSENRNEIAWVKELEPESRHYGDAYRRYGLFGDTPTIMAHCVWTDGDELRMMRERQVMVAHCPTSNLNLASGMAPIRVFLNEGVPVGLGSDISGGHDLSIFKMMVYAIQVSKMRYCQDKALPFLTLSEAFWIATKSAGQFFGKIGSFEPGYEFDALVINDSELNHDNYSLLHRLERFIYLGDDRHITHRFCRGQLIAEPKI